MHIYLSRSSITEVVLEDYLREDVPDMLLHLVKEAADHHGRMLQAVTDDTHCQHFSSISSVVVQHSREQCALVLKIFLISEKY